jgi:hypothetical protein
MTTGSDRCLDCGVGLGEFHRSGCDTEQCPYCGWQLTSCGCPGTPPLGDRLPWTGLWLGVAECRVFTKQGLVRGGFAAGHGQLRVGRDLPHATVPGPPLKHPRTGRLVPFAVGGR